MADSLSLDARAKVNLRLRVFPAGADGYHPIETIFCRISLCDRVRLRLRDRPGVRLTTSGDAPRGRANLAVRAAEALLLRARATGAQIDLEKTIPQAAGLGGGSSDAAAVLRGLNTLLGEPLSRDALLEIAAGLGADVPFFVCDTPMARGRDRGDRIEPLTPLPPAPALVVCPAVAVSTASAYRAWDAWASRRGVAAAAGRGPDADERSSAQSLATWEEAAVIAENDFEAVAFELHSELVAVKRRLLESGPYFALLAGSGASFFAPYPTAAARDAAAASLRGETRAQVFSVTMPE